MKEQQITSSLIQLRALVSGIYAKLDALGTASAPTVDFAVDMFDRQDQDTLGSYWSNTDWAIRGGRAVRSGAVTAVNKSIASTTSTGLAGLAVAWIINGDISGIRSCVYQADISNYNFTAEAPFFLASTSYTPPRYPTPFAGYLQLINGVDYFQAGVGYGIANGAGIVAANGANGAEGFATLAWEAPSLLAKYPSQVEATLPSAPACRIRHGTDSAITLLPPIAEEIITAVVEAGSIEVKQLVATYSIPLTIGGSNLLRMECANNITTFTLSGVVIQSGTLSSVSQKSRTRAGIASFPGSVLAAAAATGFTNFGGTESFKMWRNDIPVPPDESGHGTYVNGRWQYTDKYHTANVDAEGNIIRNEDGTVASYTYDPEA